MAPKAMKAMRAMKPMMTKQTMKKKTKKGRKKKIDPQNPWYNELVNCAEEALCQLESLERDGILGPVIRELRTIIYMARRKRWIMLVPPHKIGGTMTVPRHKLGLGTHGDSR